MDNRRRRVWRYIMLGIAAGTSIWVLSLSSADALDKSNCLQCHGESEITKTNGDGDAISLHVDSAALNKSAHKYTDCTQCHTKPMAGVSPLNKLSLADACGSCHQYERDSHKDSVHGEQLALGNQEVASCVDCHSSNGTPHSVLPVLSADSPAYKKNIAGTCNQCHGNEELMAGYGIVEKVYESYMRSFHGKTMELENADIKKLNTATCTNCHGVHNIRKTDDPASPVASLNNLVATCQQCHPGANENFAEGFLGHEEASIKTSAPVFFAERFFVVFTAAVVFAGISLVGLATLRSMKNSRRNGGAQS